MSAPTAPLPTEKAGRLHQAARSLVRRARGLGGRLGPQATAAGAWAGRLEEEKLALQALIRGTEQEFLATGKGLTGLAQQLKVIQNDCQALTDLTLGRHQDTAIQFAFQLLKKAEDLVLASYEQYDHVFATFRELQTGLTRLAKQHGELMRVLGPLDFITVSFRIEASRHSAEVQQTFFTLAGAINGTVAEVRAALGRQFAELATSEQIARDLMAKVATATELHRREVTATLVGSRKRLHAFSLAIAESGTAAADLVQLNQAVTRHIGSIVMAQQCQDITRQRLEHVGGAMDEMRARLLPTRPGPSAEHHEFVGQAAQIQLQQAASVFAELNQAAATLKTGIESLRAEAGTAAQAAVRVGGHALDARFSRECQDGINQILASVREAVEKIADLLAAFAPLQASFVNCTSQATLLAADIQRAALNAQIFAVHAPAGATLEVLAGRVRVIAEETLAHVEKLGAALHHTDGMVNQLRERLADFQQLGRSEQDLLTEEALVSLKKLADLDAAIPQLIQHITQQQGALAQSAGQVLAEVRFPVTVAAASSRSAAFFHELVAWSEAQGPASGVGATASRQIEALRSTYTMDSERRAHAAAVRPDLASTGTAAAPGPTVFFDETTPATPAPEPAATGAALGANVELF